MKICILMTALVSISLWIAFFSQRPAFASEEDARQAIAAPQYQANIATLGENLSVQAALEHILTLEPRTLSDLIEITEIPAPPFAEEHRAAHFADMLRRAGLSDVSIDDIGNVVGRRPGTVGDRTIALSAHLDTVFPLTTDVTVRTEGQRHFAPGIGDNSRGLIVVLTVLRAMEHAGLKTEADILFIGNVGEEGLGDLRGIKHLFRQGAEPIDSIIVVDGGSASRIVTGGVGSHRYRITYRGPGGHSWGAFGMANPHHALGRAISLFDQTALAVTREGPRTSYNIGRMGGGTSINSIPFESWMEVDMRSETQEKLDEIDAVFQLALQQALEEENREREYGPSLEVVIERVGTRPAAQGDRYSQLVQHAIAATLAFEIEPVLLSSSTDSNLPLSLGIPAVTISRGGQGGNSHSPYEWWENADGHVSIQIGLLILLAEAILAK
ncbi:MAG: M20/M25/M40 family metallo-hydrolase [Gammaproteobacteria bacterium]|nr:M20/M25/M40 family metallo-hydrolase [Gammaproteobacteria bacterium]MCY4358521.1 M20/M25/M40 family metallo-hydrolase [Gammaproteobacteria bacterium]